MTPSPGSTTRRPTARVVGWRGGWLRTEGRGRGGSSGGRELENFASNDYLGLAADPRVVAAAVEAAARYGWGAGASPLVCGWREPHEALAVALADFEEVEAVVLFPTGFAANLGTIAALVGAGDAVYGDRLNHACLVDGVRVSGASLRVYPHNDADRLAVILARERGRFRRVLIATDGVFSMDGDLAPLADLADLAERYGAMLLVDEAHGTGVFGAGGRGRRRGVRGVGTRPREGGHAVEGPGVDRRLRRRFPTADRPSRSTRADLDLLDRPPAPGRRRGKRGAADHAGGALAACARPRAGGSASGVAVVPGPRRGPFRRADRAGPRRRARTGASRSRRRSAIAATSSRRSDRRRCRRGRLGCGSA